MGSGFVILLAVVNLALLYLALAAPVGRRTVRVATTIGASRERLWSALWPLAADAGWSGEIVEAKAEGGGGAVVKLGWEGRDGLPIVRHLRFENVVEGVSFDSVVIEDSSLDPEFWRHYRESTSLSEEMGGTRVTLARTDRYRGMAFLIFRYFALRREAAKLQIWAETGQYRAGGWFEHPLSQLGFALLSALILWPFFGLTVAGLALALVLTSVVALHELGHMAAFRVMGHRRTRMIFIPLLGGLAIGGRPYDSRFEVAFVALMGAGFSAFLVPIAIALSSAARDADMGKAAALAWAFAGCLGLFNIANLIPVWKFDGGQVLRQIVGTPVLLAATAFMMLAAFMAVGYHVGLSLSVLMAAAAAFAILGVMTSGSSVKPRHALREIDRFERGMIGAGLTATFFVHAAGVIWAFENFPTAMR